MSEVTQETQENQQPVQAVESQSKETKVEIKVRDYTDEELLNSALKNKSVYDKIYNQVRDKFIGKTLGVDTKELTDEHRKLELIPKTEFEKVTNEFNMFKNQTVVKAEFGDNFELLEKHIDYSQELEPQIESIKTKFSKLFSQEPQGKLNDNSSKPIQQKDKKTQMEELLKTAKKGGIEGKKALTEWTRLQNSL